MTVSSMPRQLLIAIIVGGILLFVCPSIAQTPPTDAGQSGSSSGNGDIAAKLQAARQQREVDIQAARREVAAAIDTQRSVSADAGDLQAVKSFTGAKAQILRDGTLPRDVKDPTILLARQRMEHAVDAANLKLVDALDSTVLAYAQARRFIEAQAIQDELNKFSQDPRVALALARRRSAATTAEPSHHADAQDHKATAGAIVHFAARLPPLFESARPISFVKGALELPEHTYVRTRQGDFLSHDFTLDVWLTIDPKGPEAQIGIGSGNDGMHATPVNSLYMNIRPSDGSVSLALREGYGNEGIGEHLDAGEYLCRIEKSGNAVTFSIGSETNGEFEPDVTRTITDITQTEAKFDGRNMHVFFGGGRYTQYRFSNFAVSSAAARAADGAAAPAASTDRDIVRLTANLPASMECESSFSAYKDHVLLPARTYIRTRAGDYLHKDFTLDLWMSVGPKLPECFVGLGSGKNGGHATPVNSIYMVVTPRCDVQMATREGYGDDGIGKISDPGNYVVRLEKKGTAVTYSIGSENNGEFKPEVTKTFSDITNTPANFTDKNMHIFFGGGILKQYRLTESK